jgi:hypothetical protein
LLSFSAGVNEADVRTRRDARAIQARLDGWRVVVGAFGHWEASDDPRLRDYFGEADLAVVGEARELAAGVASHLGIEQYLPSAKPPLAAMLASWSPRSNALATLGCSRRRTRSERLVARFAPGFLLGTR